MTAIPGNSNAEKYVIDISKNIVIIWKDTLANANIPKNINAVNSNTKKAFA
jgi:hypothetical protein